VFGPPGRPIRDGGRLAGRQRATGAPGEDGDGAPETVAGAFFGSPTGAALAVALLALSLLAGLLGWRRIRPRA
jgi:hypothetical protein